MAEDRMKLTDHLADLRKRIIYTLVVFMILLFAGLAVVSKLYNFFVRPLSQAGYRLIVTSPGEVITVYLSMAGVVAVGLTLPFALYQLWRFISPGLRPVERRYTLQLLPFVLIMFVIGVCFAWFIIFPTILHFLLEIANQRFQVLYRAGAYFSFMTSICLPFGFIFELPIVVVFLTRLGIITPTWMRKMRRYAYLICVLLGVFISPPELISHLSVVLPMIALYEISIVLSAMALRRRDRIRQQTQ
ncbi:twin-arginine translocase subunit TatC [Alicyclobacillus mengziensis]|uniref:Sec-independent protein translocase protein TatC n=1 Tax=Alicyclobacillus mengziensis TaxID=2931921 RepID=A0A9X7W088_9BACL|nr:twin-arginine translocase subunit TatC [Alicyclobacillus mengziensis]QSO46973.1 twin-arginine translocase subunit TatC [Alicyclobacillus mengziensis]